MKTNGLELNVNDLVDEVIRLVEEKMLAEAKAERIKETKTTWKPFSQRPPHVCTHYLVYSRLNWASGGNMDPAKELHEHMKVAYYDAAGNFNVPEVIYWREMPEPPQRGGSDK